MRTKKKVTSTDCPLLLLCILFYLNYLALMLSFSLPTPLPPAAPFPSKGRLKKKKKKAEVIISPFKVKPITGRGQLSLVLKYTPWTPAELRVLAKEFSPSESKSIGIC